MPTNSVHIPNISRLVGNCYAVCCAMIECGAVQVSWQSSKGPDDKDILLITCVPNSTEQVNCV